MGMDEVWKMVTGGGIGAAIGAAATQFFNYMLARAKQPADQYDSLVVRLQGLMETDRKHYETVIVNERAHFEQLLDQERKHCDARITKLEECERRYEEREQTYIERDRESQAKIGHLEGCLEEQRRTLGMLLNKSMDHEASIKGVEEKTQAAKSQIPGT